MAHVYLDNLTLQTLLCDEKHAHLLPKWCEELNGQKKLQISFDWPSLLQLTGLASVFESFPLLTLESPLFSLMIATLAEKTPEELLTRLYDQLFVECLTQVKSLEVANPHFLISSIQKTRAAALPAYCISALESYEKRLRDDPLNTRHDLILYLAWDRVCANFGMIFDHQAHLNPQGLEVFKRCLLETFQHVKQQGKASPGFFRLLETFYAYLMREEKIQAYSDEAWLLLSKASAVLKPQKSLSDVFYIDKMIGDAQAKGDDPPSLFFTMDPPEKVSTGVSFARYVLEQLKREENWPFTLCPAKVVCLQEKNGVLLIDAILTTTHLDESS